MKYNIYLILGGIVNFITAILHTTIGHAGHLSSILESEIKAGDKTVLLGVWHMISIVLFMSCYPAVKKGLNAASIKYNLLIRYLGVMYLLFGFLFILCSIYMKCNAPQWFLLIPIGVLFILGTKKSKSQLS